MLTSGELVGMQSQHLDAHGSEITAEVTNVITRWNVMKSCIKRTVCHSLQRPPDTAVQGWIAKLQRKGYDHTGANMNRSMVSFWTKESSHFLTVNDSNLCRIGHR